MDSRDYRFGQENYSEISNKSAENLLAFQPLGLEYLLVTVMVTLLAAVGISGNIPVLIIYFRRKERKASNTFIKVLAFLDLLVCIFVMPYTIVYEYHLVTSDIVCRAFEVVRHFSVLASNVTLVAIASERYIAVCRIGTRLSVSTINHGVFCIMVVSLLISCPAIGVFAVVSDQDVQDVPCHFPHDQTAVKFCHFTFSVMGETLVKLYQVVQMGLFFLELILIVVLYTIIYVVLWQKTVVRENLTKRRTSSTTVERQSSTCGATNDVEKTQTNIEDDSFSCTPDANDDLFVDRSIEVQLQETKLHDETLNQDTQESEKRVAQSIKADDMHYSQCHNIPEINDQNKDITDESDEEPSIDNKLDTKRADQRVTFQNNVNIVKTDTQVTLLSNGICTSPANRKSKLTFTFGTIEKNRKKRYYHRRTAKMLFLCTVIYFITWMPFWLDIFGMTNSLILRHLFLIGHATNPIIYGVVNKQVRKSLKRLFISFCRRWCFKTPPSAQGEYSFNGSISGISR
ncbi:OAR-like protein [Mya arenaria]|uniref:OAR-like protein n=1 Tax=Mya arenaria TaxID=6604 RepID=A0ABY7E0Y8_MYAAR|nr:uncharacterized protein LOC128230323 [Mya arenaria]WAR03648.1 OAR-like protein [Mya arenaria]